MTDISESGIEAARKAVLPLLWERNAQKVAEAAIQAYLPFHPPASREEGLRVKPLEWDEGYTDANYISFEAVTIVGRYSVWRVNPQTLWRVNYDGADRDYAQTEQEAKAKAQEHYEQRILSALIPTKPEAKEPPGVAEAFTALDLADSLIERAYGVDVPREWNAAYRKVAKARALQSKKPE